MKVRKLVCLISLAILGSVLSQMGSIHTATSANPVLRADGTGPVPPPPPRPPVPSPFSNIVCAPNGEGADILESSSSLCANISQTSPTAAASVFDQILWWVGNAAEAFLLLRSISEKLY